MSWDDAVEAFKKTLPRYEERPSQTQLAHAMEKALVDGQPLLAQAPPGTGKSYPAIVVAMDRAVESGAPSVCSTATKALQDQYIADCTNIKTNVFPEFRFMVLKGRSNYLCPAKMAKADEVLLGLPKSIDEITQVAERDEILGDVDRLGFELTPTQRRELTTTSEECPGKKSCPFGSQCFAEKAKAKAERAHVIVVSHAMLAIDAVLKERNIAILPEYPNLVVDEAHELRSYVEGALSIQITKRSLDQLTTDVGNMIDELDLVHAGRLAFEPLFRKLEGVLGRPKRFGYEPQAVTPAVLGQMSEELVAVYEHLQVLEGKLAVHQVFTDDDQDRKNRLKRRIISASDKIGHVMADSFSETVRWVEKDGDFPIKLCTAPLDVAPFLHQSLWSATNAVLMSATLALGDDFTYMAVEHGIDRVGPYQTFDCPTPFSFEKQAVTYIPEGMPDLRTNPEAHLAMFNMHNLELIKAAGGRTMLLFTSWDSLNGSYAELAPRLRDMGLTVFKQGDMGSTRALADAFRDDETSVLFATKSFFTGVNIEGNSLLYLGIYKAPYHFPDVLWKARCDAVDAQCDDRSKWTKGSFPTLQLPDMMFTLVQGFGRLIRSMSDRGMVGIFDPALAVHGGKKYGKKVREALPPAPLEDNLRAAVTHLTQLREEIEAMTEEGAA